MGAFPDNEFQCINSISKENRVVIKTKSDSVHDNTQILEEAFRDRTTELEQANLLLERERDMAQKYLDIAGVIMIALDSTGTITLINKKGCQVLGGQSEDIIGKNWFDTFLCDEEMESVKIVFRKLMAGELEPVEYYENKVRSLSGSEKTIVWHNTLLRDDKEKIIGTLSSGENITRRKIIENRMRELSSMIEQSADSVVQTDMNFKIKYINDSAEKLYGYSLDEIIGKSPDIFNTEPAAPEIQQEIYNIVSSGEIHLGECLNRRKDGSIFYCQYRISPIRDNNGEITGYMGSLRDISGVKKAEQTLRQSEEKYRLLVESLNQGIALISPDMKILSANRQMKEWFPDLKEDGQLLCYKAFNNPHREKPCSYCPAIKAFDDGRTHEEITQKQDGDKIRNYRVVAIPQKNKQGEVVSVIESVEDITDSLRLKNELQKREKLESIGILAGGIVHDFNNILVAIMGNISLAKMDIPEKSEPFILLNEAEKASDRAKDLTNQLLTFSKGGAPIFKTSNIIDIIKETSEFTLRGSKVKCHYDFEKECITADIDCSQFSQVISNLVINAVQAMPQGGQLRISASLKTNSNADAGFDDSLKYARITIADEGIGIAPDNIKKIFDPFFTTKEKGNGLGLSGCYSIISNHHGYIEVDSEIGKGTAFNVFIPVSPNQISENENENDDNYNGSEHILVVDDDKSVRTLMSNMLGRFGYEAITVESGEKAVNICEKAVKSGSSFDAAIIDLTIPGGMGGEDIIVELKKINPQIKAIVSSGYSDNQILAYYEDYGFASRISKPFTSSEVGHELKRVLSD